MKRGMVSGPTWRNSIGIGIALLSAIVLGFVLWHTSNLEKVAGAGQQALEREQLAIGINRELFSALQDVCAYRQAVAVLAPPGQVAQRRSVVDRDMAQLTGDITLGPASVLGLDRSWSGVNKDWNTARAATGTTAVDDATSLVLSMEDVLSSAADNSGLTYDPDPVEQNLSDAVSNEIVGALASAERTRLFVDEVARTKTWTLRERIDLASMMHSLSIDTLSIDEIPKVSSLLATALPSSPEHYAKFPDRVADYVAANARLVTLLNQRVLLVQARDIPTTLVDVTAARAIEQSIKMHGIATTAIADHLAFRIDAARQRNQAWYLAVLLCAVMLIGLMLAIAELSARRDRLALHEARRESEQLSAELARQNAEEALRLSEAQFRAVFEGAAIGIAVVDRSGRLLDSNSVFRSMFGDDIAEALHGHEQHLSDVLSGTRDTFEFEQHVKGGIGPDIWADVTVSAVSDDSSEAPVFAVCMFRDKTALKHSERRIEHDKTHDALTGLPNRALFEEHLQRRFDEANALLDSFFAVLFVDLEHFKDVNESLGHGTGDTVLSQIAQRIRSSVDPRDIVARLGSDEFAVLIQSLGDILHVESVARRILNNLAKSMQVGERTIYLSGSVGIAIGSASHERSEDVMRDAEIAMQNAKSVGGPRYAVFDSKMQDRSQKRLQLTSDIRLALERNEFRLLYQPIVSMEDGSLVGCEALIRWDHPVEGVVNPSDFMPLAEQHGLATPIGRFVLSSATAQLAAWRRNRSGMLSFTMHVNVSASELIDPDFERTLMGLVEHHGLASEDLTIEITEGVVLDSGTRANLTLERVREHGFKICIDDFGTGYSSLRYLQQFQVDAIKIDRGFVSGADGELASEPIVRTLMTLAEAFDVRVVAEGVETARQLEILRSAGCRYAQGYLFSRPVSPEDMVNLYPAVLGRIARSQSA